MKTGPPRESLQKPRPRVPAAQGSEELSAHGRKATFTWGTRPLWMPPPGSTPGSAGLQHPNSAASAWSGPPPYSQPKGSKEWGQASWLSAGEDTPAICRPQAGTSPLLGPGPDSACAADKTSKGPASRASQRCGLGSPSCTHSPR